MHSLENNNQYLIKILLYSIQLSQVNHDSRYEKISSILNSIVAFPPRECGRAGGDNCGTLSSDITGVQGNRYGKHRGGHSGQRFCNLLEPCSTRISKSESDQPDPCQLASRIQCRSILRLSGRDVLRGWNRNHWWPHHLSQPR